MTSFSFLSPVSDFSELEAPSSYLMKSPPVQIVDSEAHANTERFIKQNAVKAVKKTKVAAKA